jgi:hypothetical protein
VDAGEFGRINTLKRTPNSMQTKSFLTNKPMNARYIHTNYDLLLFSMEVHFVPHLLSVVYQYSTSAKRIGVQFILL